MLRLLAIGDCNTGGVEHGDPTERVPSQLALRLNALGVPCVEQNLGYTMSTSREGLVRIGRDAGPADLLLLNFGLVDAWITSLPRLYLSYYPDNPAKRAGRKLLKSVKRRLRAPALRRFVPLGEVVPLDEYDRNLRQILAAGFARNPNMHAILWTTVAVRDDDARNRSIARYNGRLARIVETTPGARLLDTDRALATLPPAQRYRDHLHLSAAAARKVAGAMAEICLTEIQAVAKIQRSRRAA